MAHEAKIITPLGDEALQLRHFSGSEDLSGLFTFDLTLYSTDENIKVNDLLGQNVTVQLIIDEGTYRYFNGFVSQFVFLNHSEDGQAVYHATVSPWLWFLTRTSDCRIFQDMTVLEIVKSVFTDNGFSSDFKELLKNKNKYRKWEYCVQYRESDFNFVSRLLEQEGIYYYFEHEEKSHKLILADDCGSHVSINGDSELPFHEPDLGQTVDTEHVSEWQLQHDLQPDQIMLGDYNFKTPKKSLRVEKQVARTHARKGHQVFDYPGEYTTDGEGDHYTLTRLEELSTDFEQATGTTDARYMATGGLFKLIGHPRKDQNREYLVVSAQYDISVGLYTSGGADDGPVYQCNFSAMDSNTQFRPQRVTPKPAVQGPQTAVVVGKSGQEIDTDEHGRIKVQFHWDRYGGSDEKSSCWIRVAQIWAGASWGAQFIPRIGHEVIVDFLEGDPDRPIVTGSVYNAVNKYPYSLPANKTQSGIKSRSTMDGSNDNFNEIRMEDKKGSEELYIQAEKDENILVKNCKSEQVRVNETLSVGNNRKRSVGEDETVEIGNNQTESVAKNRETIVGEDDTLQVGKKLKMEAGDEILLQTGKAKMVMSKDGKIEISGMDITIKNTGGTVSIKPGGIITIKGSMVKIN